MESSGALVVRPASGACTFIIEGLAERFCRLYKFLFPAFLQREKGLPTLCFRSEALSFLHDKTLLLPHFLLNYYTL